MGLIVASGDSHGERYREAVRRSERDARATPGDRGSHGGRHGGDVFNVFPKTFSRVHQTGIARIDFHRDGYDSWFSVEGIGEVRSTHIKNAVTGASSSGEIVLPDGIYFKRALVTSVARWFLHDTDFRIGHDDRAGFATATTYTNKGPIASDPEAVATAPSPKRARRRAR